MAANFDVHTKRRYVLLLFLFVISGTTFAENVIFEHTYVRDNGKPYTVSHAFNGSAAPAVIEVLNGGPNGSNGRRISSARISLNGNPLFDPSDFSQKASYTEREVLLRQGENHLEVQLASKPGATLTIRLLQIGVPIAIFDDSNAVSAIISSEGGVLSTTGSDGTNYSLTVPAGSLLSSEEITLTPVLAIDNLPLDEGFSAASRIEPEDISLLKPITLSIELHASSNLGYAMGFMFQDNGQDFHFLPITVDGNTATFQLPHFTIVGTSPFVGCVDIAELNNVAGPTAESIANAQMAIVVQSYNFCKDELLAHGGIEIARLIRDIHLDWYLSNLGGIRNLIGQAITDPDLFLKRAINQIDAWYRSYAWGDLSMDFNPSELFLGTAVACWQPWEDNLCEILDELADAAALAIYSAVEKEVITENNSCVVGGVNDDAAAMEWIDTWNALGADGPPFWEEGGDIDILLARKTCGMHSLEITPADFCMSVGGTARLDVTAKDGSGQTLELGNPPLPYRDLDYPVFQTANIVSVEEIVNGSIEVTALALGEATITAGITLSGGSTVFDSASHVAVSYNLASVAVQPEKMALPPGESFPLVALLTDTNGNIFTCPAITWSTSDSNIVSVDPETGFITAHNQGVSVITAESNGIDGTVEVAVTDITGIYLGVGTETWTGCADPDDDGTYSSAGTLLIDYQQGSDFGGALGGGDPSDWFFSSLFGEILDVDQVGGNVVISAGGSGLYSESETVCDDAGCTTYNTSGTGDFTGTFNANVFSMSWTSQDTAGDTCTGVGSGTFVKQ